MTSHMRHVKFPPSTDLWVCKHDVAYPDVCRECKENPMPDQMDILRNIKPKLHRLKELGAGVRVARVLGERVLVKTVIPRTELDEYKEKGLVIPGYVEKEYTPLPTTGIVLGVGESVNPETLKEGDMVLFARLSGMDFTINEQDLRIIHVREIMAILEDTDGSVYPVKEA